MAKRTEKEMIRAMCGATSIGKSPSTETKSDF